MRPLFFIFFLLILISNSNAQNAIVIPGSKPGTTDGGLITFGSVGAFYTRALPDRSIYCHYRGSTGQDVDFSSSISCLNGTCPTGRMVGAAEGGIDSSGADNDAIAFIANNNIPSNSNLEGVTNRYLISLSTTVINLPIIVECFNTTLYGNFNTVAVANPYNFLEISNDSAININTRIVITKNDGNELARLNITIPKGQQKDISIHDISGATNTFGRITIARDGALDGIRAKLTKYTSSFSITASDKFEIRNNFQ